MGLNFMKLENELPSADSKIRKIPIIGYFWEKSFLHYIIAGGIFTFLNIFLVWLFIDVFKIPTIISSSVVIGGLFVLRYLFYRWFKVM